MFAAKLCLNLEVHLDSNGGQDEAEGVLQSLGRRCSQLDKVGRPWPERRVLLVCKKDWIRRPITETKNKLGLVKATALHPSMPLACCIVGHDDPGRRSRKSHQQTKQRLRWLQGRACTIALTRGRFRLRCGPGKAPTCELAGAFTQVDAE